MLHATNATPNIAQAESSPSAASAPATISVGAAGIGRPICSSSTFAKTNASPYCAVMRRTRPGAARGDHVRAGMASGTLAGRPAEAPAVLRRPLPVLLVDAPGLEDQRALAARHRLAAA